MKYNTFEKTDKTIFLGGASGMENSSNSTLQRTAAKKIQVFLQSNTHKALLVTGARQVGKTTLIRQQGQEAFPNFVELNFLENTAARQQRFPAAALCAGGGKAGPRQDAYLFG